jgi:hypothetical protein
VKVIELCGKRYQVRDLQGTRQVKVEGEWIDNRTFVDWLRLTEQWDQLYELARIGASANAKVTSNLKKRQYCGYRKAEQTICLGIMVFTPKPARRIGPLNLHGGASS